MFGWIELVLNQIEGITFAQHHIHDQGAGVWILVDGRMQN